jgi:hypothetical protein
MSPQSTSERYLAALCRRTFLSLWSFPNVFRNQGPPKEICDVLAVFPPHVIVFSDKSHAFRPAASLEMSWNRWFRKTVLGAALQLRGAEKWLRQFPNRVFVDPKCLEPLPVKLPSASEMIVHRVVVARGASQPCIDHFGGSGSLILASEPDAPLVDGLSLTSSSPFQVDHLGRLNLVHVLDDRTTEVLVRELDTVADLVAYLSAKEELLTSQRVCVAGDDELLAVYKTTMLDEHRHGFKFPSGKDVIYLAEGSWSEFQASPQRRAQKLADALSYRWDDLIERFAMHLRRGTLASPEESEKNQKEIVTVLSFLARESRFRRRVLVKSFHEVAVKATPEQYAARVHIPDPPGGPFYVFVVTKGRAGADRDQERENRRGLLRAYCHVLRHKHPEAQDIVGLAMDAPGSESYGDDLLYLDGRRWSAELDEEAKLIHETHGVLTSPITFKGREDEYPIRKGREPARGRARNEPCRCGSGKKAKKCCDRP